MKMARMIIASLVGVFSLACFCQAEYGGGNGTAENPYKIGTVADWQELIAASADWDKHFVLTQDIDFDGLSLVPIAPDTDSLLDGFQGTPFTGNFNGQGYALRNAVINLPSQDFVGLFGELGVGGQVLNLGIQNVCVTGLSRVGGLCGRNNGGTVSGCHTTGSVTGTSETLTNAGGLVGAITNNGLLFNSYSSCAVSGITRVGGLAGQLSAGEIRRCYATGPVTAAGEEVGGLVGLIYEPTIAGMIYNCFAANTVSGNTKVGGLVGRNYRGKVLYCYSNGTPTGASEVGGLCGAVTTGTGYQSTGNFWDTQTSLTTVSAMGTGRTTAQMQTQSTFTGAGWNFVKTWQMIDQQTYPFLTEGALDYSGGYGSAQHPFEIGNVADFFELKANVIDWSKHFILKADLDFVEKTYSQAPIAPDTSNDSDFQGTAFIGIFDGNGHVINNLTIDARVSGKSYLGLFGRINSGGEVKNLGVENVTVLGGTNSVYLGGLCGSNSGKLSDCHTTGAVIGKSETRNLGGLCGGNESLGFITDCYAIGSVIGGDNSSNLGGLCGRNFGALSDRSYIENCYASVSVSAGQGSFSVGGLCGVNYSSSIDYSYSLGAVTSGDRSEHLGGLCGRNLGTLSNGSYIENCYASGAISAGAYSSSLGGLCGSNDKGGIYDSYSLGTVTGGDRASELGGLCGRNYDASIIRCYATGVVVSGFDSHSLGGICGANAGTIAICFWDIQTSRMTSGVGGVDGGSTVDSAGKTTAQMQMQSTFADAGWEYANFQVGLRGWYMPEQGYPEFDWQNPAAGKVPDVSGLALSEVQAKLTEAGLTTGRITYVKSWKIPAGTVTGINVCSGGYADAAIPLSVFVSSGSDGDGSADNPYEIACKTDMDAINTQLSSSYIMTSDIYLGNNGYYNTAVIAPNWGTVKNMFLGTPFSGFFDGNDHVICNLYTISTESSFVGLFGYIGPQGTVADLGITNSNVKATNMYSGILCGQNDGTIRNCSIEKSTLSGGYSPSLGGICGENRGDIRYCSVKNSIVKSFYNYGFGLLCGVNRTGDIRDCYAIGTVNAANASDHFGGLCGSNSQGSISNCFYAGRFAGKYNVERVGGICGYNNLGVLSNCFWDMETSGLNIGVGGGISEGATGKTTAEMKTRATFTEAGWDFADVWAICEGTNYPRLRWQVQSADFVCPEGVYLEDLAYWIERWLLEDCGSFNNCDGADLNKDGIVNLQDFAVFVDFWCKDPSVVPDVIGMSSVEAEAAIRAAGLVVGTVSEVSSDTVAEGHVLDQTPAGGEIAPQGSSINLTVTIGISWAYLNDPGISGYEPFNGFMSKFETTNAQYARFLNAANVSGDITVSGSTVYGANGSNMGGDFEGQLYYDMGGLGNTNDGATNGGKAKINYSGGQFTVDAGFGNHPVSYVTWYGATAFCNYFGWRLPTEWEWQAAADYDGSYNFGCGSTLNNNIANYYGSIHPHGTTPVGAFGTYGYGMADMAGNVWEWTSSSSGSSRVTRGGNWESISDDCNVSHRRDRTPESKGHGLGFRVCR